MLEERGEDIRADCGPEGDIVIEIFLENASGPCGDFFENLTGQADRLSGCLVFVEMLRCSHRTRINADGPNDRLEGWVHELRVSMHEGTKKLPCDCTCSTYFCQFDILLNYLKSPVTFDLKKWENLFEEAQVRWYKAESDAKVERYQLNYFKSPVPFELTKWGRLGKELEAQNWAKKAVDARAKRRHEAATDDEDEDESVSTAQEELEDSYEWEEDEYDDQAGYEDAQSISSENEDKLRTK